MSAKYCFCLKRSAIPVLIGLISLMLLLSGCENNGVVADREKTVDLQGHRGARSYRPENTIPAFEYCLDQRMDTIELDIVVTKDNQLVVYHDLVLNGERCIDAHGAPANPIPIKDLTLAQLKQFDCGSLKHPDFKHQVPVPGTRISTLSEVFNHVFQYRKQKNREKIHLYNIELKLEKSVTQQELEERAALLVQAIENAGLVERSTVQSFVPALLPLVKKINPSLQTSALFEPTIPQGIQLMLGLTANSDEIMQKTIEVEADIISPYYLYVKPEFIKTAHTNNLKVVPWTVNKTKTMVELLNLGVDGLISDDPKLLYQTYQKWRRSEL